MKTELIYNTSKELPIYAGDYEIQHKECPFIPISRQIEEEISLNVVTTPEQLQKKLHRVRFLVKRPIARSEVEAKMSIIPGVVKMVIWADGITKVELECREQMLDTVMPITQLTFGDIQDYRATMEEEKIRLISPSSIGMSGKERLLTFEEKMKEYGDAELIGFHQFAAEDIETRINRVLDEGYLESWVSSEDVKILNTAYQMGYFEIPRRCKLEDLTAKLGISVTTLNGKLRLLNRVLAERFLEKSKQPLPP